MAASGGGGRTRISMRFPSDRLHPGAKRIADVCSRSVPGQVELPATAVRASPRSSPSVPRPPARIAKNPDGACSLVASARSTGRSRRSHVVITDHPLPRRTRDIGHRAADYRINVRPRTPAARTSGVRSASGASAARRRRTLCIPAAEATRSRSGHSPKSRSPYRLGAALPTSCDASPPKGGRR
jgi:hypothetical protein